MRTLLVLAGEPQGITDEEISVGDIIKMGSEKSKPVIVSQIIDMPMDMTEEGRLVPKYGEMVDAEKVAYLHIDEKIEKKFTSKKRSSKLEKSMAKDIGGHTVVGSGAFDFHKGDVSSKIWLGEHKFTDKDYYSLTTNTWNKIKDEAFSVNKLPIMQVVIAEDTKPAKLFIMNLFDFQTETNASEEEVVQLFYFHIISTKNKSLRLFSEVINEHSNNARYNGKMPGFLLTFETEKIQLIAIEPEDFIRIFND